jgi:DNA-binding transcriptional LysR family regulator
MDDLRLTHLRTFVAVAEQLHFGNAARRLGIPQPTASRHVRELEAALGVELLTRTSRSTALTDAGAVTLEHAHAVLERVARLEAAAATAARRAHGEVTVGFISSTVGSYLPPLVQRLAVEHPDVELRVVHLRVRDLADQLRDHTLDLAVARDHRFGAADLVEERVAAEPMLLAVALDSPLAGRDGVPVADLRGEPLIMLPPSTSPTGQERWLHRLREAGVEPRAARHATSYQAAIALVAAGRGVFALPSGAAVARPDVRYVRLLDMMSPVVLLHRAGAAPAPRVAAVIEAVRAIAGPVAAAAT